MKSGLEWRSLTSFGSRGTRNAVAPPSGGLILGPRFRAQKAAHNLGPRARHPTARCRARGARIRAAFWAQKTVLEIRPPGGPAGWVKMRAPGMIRTPCQAKARVTVRIVSPTQARLLFVLSVPVARLRFQSLLSRREGARSGDPLRHVRCARACARARPTYIFDACQKPAT